MDFSPPEIGSEKESSEPVPIAQPTVSESAVQDGPVGPIVKTGDNVKSKINIELSVSCYSSIISTRCARSVIF